MAAPPLHVLRFLVLASVLLAPLVAHAGSGAEIGDARTIVSLVKADFAKEERDLEVGDVVRQDEVIEVSDDGRGEFRLNDDTKLALGPGARMVLDKFVYDSDKKSGSIIVDLTKGAFRFITGVASKKTYEIRTPNASITVRGTIFDVYVLSDKSAWLLLHEGAIEVTSPKKDVCRVLDQPGQLIRIDSKANVSDPLNWKDMPARDAATFEDAFPFVVAAPQIEPLPPTSRDGILEAAFPKADNKKCINGLKAKPIKADDGDKPKKKKKPKTRQATNDDAPKKRRPKPADDDDYGGGARGIDIIIKGGGFGGFGGGRPGGNDGGGYGGRGR
ncbi:transmembrane sensor [Hyphomicrobium sp. 1Nfss2.1]|uniref:FecR family protein n=1 Tax=Hyphomicrobium sp. 1Nfss2.1 TaxID=3413936 RepID=UPI003C7E81D8